MRASLTVPWEFINVECAPVQIIDTANMTVLAGPQGLKPGDELTVCDLDSFPLFPTFPLVFPRPFPFPILSPKVDRSTYCVRVCP